MDPTKTQGVVDWPRPTNVTEVRSFLGFTGFYRYFIPNYSKIARPLLDLTKKTTVWHWDEPQKQAFEKLKTLMCQQPVLAQPNYKRPFVVHTDTSAYGVGAILLQEGESTEANATQKPKLHPLAYYSASFIQAERNYDIYERELLAVVKALKHWHHHLAGAKHPFTVVTDHANLAYWKESRDLNRRTARWHSFLQDYWFFIQITPGKNHSAADFLSRHPHNDQGTRDNTQITIFPTDKFIDSKYIIPDHLKGNAPLPQTMNLRVADIDREFDDWDSTIAWIQRQYQKTLKEWKSEYNITPPRKGDHQRSWSKDGKLVVPPDQGLKRKLMTYIHDGYTAGHPGRDETIRKAKRFFWWPNMHLWIEDYVRGCATCQQGKILTHRTRAPLYKIPTTLETLSFETVTMDLIIGLPPNGVLDSILTIVDHGCTHAALFLPCSSMVTGPKVAQLYLDNVYKWFGLPNRMISDRDPRFTSHFARALAAKLGVSQNLSTAFHPQTDGLSERKNQWIEQYLRLLTAGQQDDWSQWLSIATAVHNDRTNDTLGMSPNEALLGYRPRLFPAQPIETSNQHAEDRINVLHQKRAQATAAINKAARTPDALKDLFNLGDKVWLESKNLALPHQSKKLAPKRVGPFSITKVILPVTYQLELPHSWQIHDVFHASLLTPYHETEAYGPNFIKPPPDLIDGEEEYEVEAILNHRFHGRRKQLQYLIKWKGYPHSDNTWEPSENVHADDLVKSYHKWRPLQDKRQPRTTTRVISPWNAFSNPLQPLSSPQIPGSQPTSNHTSATLVPTCPTTASTTPSPPRAPGPPLPTLPRSITPLPSFSTKTLPCPPTPSSPPLLPTTKSPPKPFEKSS